MTSIRVLVTGSGGLVGSALTRGFTEAGIAVDTVIRAESPQETARAEVSENGSRSWIIAWPAGLQEIPYDSYDAVIHLAIPPIIGHEPIEELIESHTKPVEMIANGIRGAGNRCLLLFTSSRSASCHATSRYGRGKWEAEQLLRKSSVPWVILRPGLIVGTSSRGLFAGIVKLVQSLPVIVVPSGKEVVVQPVLLEDVVAACIQIAREPKRHAGRTYDVALQGIPLKSLLHEICVMLGRSRLVVPINWRWFAFVLWFFQIVSPRLLSYRESLLGLVGSRSGATDTEVEPFDILLHPLSKKCLPLGNPESALSEGEYLFRAIFRADPPRELLLKYSSYQKPALLNGTWIDTGTIVRRRLSVEAIEFATRRKNTILSQKVMILCYITELFPSCAPHFINNRNCRLKAFAVLGMSGVKSAWNLFYGTYLVKRYRLLDPAPEGASMSTEPRS